MCIHIRLYINFFKYKSSLIKVCIFVLELVLFFHRRFVCVRVWWHCAWVVITSYVLHLVGGDIFYTLIIHFARGGPFRKNYIKKKIMVVVGQSRLGRSNIVVLVACIIIIVTVVFCWEHILLVPVVETHDTYSVDKLCCDFLYCTKWNKLKKNLICPKQTGFHFNLLNSIVLIKLS